ncbi:hypothetical protein EG856_02155 [Mycoplasmopsis phocirhinis]|uniref:ABM domain-containing protein n=1 Tax=Mycoplasmopsis phocirhinis TaxID=142650 RepID=A0A4P6MP96_9BACT|nr:antibiotic biosynthesis monooxygenase [Mycoplasmopsis phocirhinis]QBF34710.1 hypothetical protein EG856_02155 [Mycoplasmopsis phocirhinis]
MISLIIKEIKIKKENMNNFNEYIKNWIYVSKQQELNLSIDGFWAGDKFNIVERWSSEESFNKFAKTEQYKEFLTFVENSAQMPLKIKKYKTII